MTLLLLAILTPLAVAAVVSLGPANRAKDIATAGMFGSLLFALLAAFRYDWTRSGDFQLAGSLEWLPALGLNISIGVDSVAMLLILLTALLGPICSIASYTAITERVRTYYAWLLILQAAMIGVFAARDLILFYICFEFTLIPMWVLINLFGSTNRKAAATKFFLYTFTGSLIALAGLVYVAWFNATGVPAGSFPGAGEWTFDIAALQAAAASMPASTQAWVLLALLAGFAVKVPLFPVHTWLPLAHTEAPTAGSVILAGVLLKLGTYGIYRFALPFAPAAVVEYSTLIGVLCVVGILYAGLICWVQTDVKKLVAYSSVSHLGFCVLGLVALNVTGVTGSVLYMINHGLSTGALFLLIGMIYERYHTRSMKELGGLAAKMPIWATFMVFFAMASVALPGLNGFISEFLCLIGAFQADSSWALRPGPTPGATPGGLGPWFGLFAGMGMIVGAMYLLYMVGHIVWGPLIEPHAHHAHGGHGEASHAHEAHAPALPRDLNAREIGVLLPLAALCVVLGIYPTPILRVLETPADQLVVDVRSAAGLAPAGPAVEAANESQPQAAQLAEVNR